MVSERKITAVSRKLTQVFLKKKINQKDQETLLAIK